MIEQQNSIVVIAGFRGSDKTTLASTLLRTQRGVVIYDPNEDPAYDWVPNTVYSLYDGEKSLSKFFVWVAREKKTSLVVRYIPEEEESGTLFNDANEFCRLVWCCHGVWVCFEEVHQIANTASPSSMPPQLRKLINRGRHQRISVVVTGLRFAEIPRPITAGASFHIVFATQEPLDTEELRRRLGFEATDEIMKLDPHQAIAFDVLTRKWRIVDSYGNVVSGERENKGILPARLVSGDGELEAEI